MFLSAGLVEAMELVLQKTCSIADPVFVDGQVGGGINECLRLKAGNRRFFAKINSAARYPRLFALEAQGLKVIRETNTIAVPEVLGFGVAGDQQFLLLEWIYQAPGSRGAQRALGTQLARMHKTTSSEFGFDYDNYIGSLPQVNSNTETWTDFYIRHRIGPMLQMALSKKLVNKADIHGFELLFKRLEELFPQEPPALVHGDLWSGNYMISSSEVPVLVDPAQYFGHREMDLAMSALFGGFEASFYDGYQDEFPLEAGWEDRLGLWQLYPLLVHLNLFGTVYLPQIRHALKKYV